ncbi:MAG: hypothetical protein Q8P67_05095 [archaeon]|nr:hypothetical protein [archaeon]
MSDSTAAYGAFGSSELYANLAGVRGKPEEEDAKITLVEPLPSSVLFSSLSLQLEAQDRTLKLTMEWIDEHDSAVIRTRRVMWDLAWVAHPMYVDAFFRHGEFIAHVFKPKPDGRFRRLVVPELRLGADPSSGRQRVEVQPRADADASEFHCLLLPSVFPEQGRVFFVDGREFHFVFSHQETQQLSDGTSVITDLTTHRHLSLPLPVPSRTVFFSPPLSVIAMRGLKSHESTGNIQIINLELH